MPLTISGLLRWRHDRHERTFTRLLDLAMRGLVDREAAQKALERRDYRSAKRLVYDAYLASTVESY